MILAAGLLVTAAVACADKPVDPNNELPSGNVDTPRAGDLLRPGPTFVGGWAMDDSGVAAIRIYFDGHFRAQTIPTIPRPDVAKAFPKYARPGDLYGWNIQIDFATTSGPHTILVQAVDTSGATKDIGVVPVTGAR